MYLRGLVEIVFSAARTFGVIDASPVSTINTPSSPACTVILLPAPMITCTLPCTGSTSTSPGAGAVKRGGQTAGRLAA